MQYLCDLFSRFQGVAAPRSRCAACWRPRTSISRIKSEIFERPKIPHRPARQSRQPTPTTTTSCNKFARLGGYWEGTRAAGSPARRFALLTNSTLQEEELQWWIRAG
ncbi:hypothetical protein N657DRAFT_313568 [Parathielavia appendiculata]|uniref:Uncharacterized protein n=1 Tax=Parathielavia appendiculata TaxID=2587402 RepID=A0AAN6U579_9PEZI|nr:hypothetical protein N657DRAFT_313568 [Parathielavia appendiculata]